MSKFLDCYSNDCPNYLYPFFLVSDKTREGFIEEIDAVKNAGCKGIVLECRGHTDFVGERWWDDIRFYLQEAKNRNMKVWFQDDKRFPSGFASDSIETKHPELRRKRIVMENLDVVGPQKDAALLIENFLSNDDSIYAIIAYKRSDDYISENYSEAINLTEKLKDGIILWDIPEGMWRVYIIFDSKRGSDFYKNYIDMLNPLSCKLMIDEIYDKHYENLKDFYGNTFEAFFSDESCFGNSIPKKEYDYHYKLGIDEAIVPWREDMLELLAKKLGFTTQKTLLLLPSLWQDVNNSTPAIRCAYMDIISDFYRENFCKQLGNWCHEHGIKYYGHIIEDGDAHMRFGCGPGHYFRSQEGQDAAGFDLVLQQLQVGNRSLPYIYFGGGKYADPRFYMYVIGRLAASCAHAFPHMNGEVMCECAGANGWAAGVPTMKYYYDAMVVGGGNKFVSAVFYPEKDFDRFPPFAYERGENPYYPYQKPLMEYLNRLCHLLSGGVHKANALIYYQAEGDWCGNVRDTAYTATPLALNHIDFDFAPWDFLKPNAIKMVENKICINKETFDALVIPPCEYLPTEILNGFDEIAKTVPVIFTDSFPKYAETKEQFGAKNAICMSIRDIPSWFKKNGFLDYVLEGNEDLLHLHISHSGTETYFFFNSSSVNSIDATLKFSYRGNYVIYNAWDNSGISRTTKDGNVHLEMHPRGTVIISFGADAPKNLYNSLPEFVNSAKWKHIPDNTEFEVSVLEYNKKERVNGPNIKAQKLKNIITENPRFAGTVKYKATFNDTNVRFIDLGLVGEIASLTVNNVKCGDLINGPFVFDVSSVWKDGENIVEILVSTNLVYAKRDRFSKLLALPPAGLIGPIRLGK